MKVCHRLSGKEVSRDIDENLSFLLTNKKGGFTFFGAQSNDSRFQGVYFSDKFTVFKVIDDIRLAGTEVTGITNRFHSVDRHSGQATERFFTNSSDALVYNVSDFNGFIELTLDCRELYDFHDEGRMYQITGSDDSIIVEYNKYKESGLQDYRIYLVIKGVKEYMKIDKWVPRYYQFDHKRGSSPYNLYVYKAIQIKVDKDIGLVMGYGDTKEKAVAAAEHVHSNQEFLLKSKENYIATLTKTKLIAENDVSLAYQNSLCSMDTFVLDTDDGPAIIAGYPWFTQVWTRDEAISLGSLIAEERYDEAKAIILRHISCILKDGRVPNRHPASMLGSADGVGWVWARLHELLIKLQANDQLSEYCSLNDLMDIKKRLSVSIRRLIRSHSKDGLSYNEALETWMDTGFKDDVRAGFRIEIQALRLSMYKLMTHLASMTDDKLKFHAYSELLELTQKHVLDAFWKKPVLSDGKDDSTVRPNIFLAYYIYPGLLSKREWIACFDHALKVLWLDWGGLATIDRNHKYFIDTYTGQDNRSYHRGDSWYFVNHIAAICMHRLDKRYQKYVQSIIKASSEELLYKGIIGYSAELSSAKELAAQASLAQAWSSATFIELISETNSL